MDGVRYWAGSLADSLTGIWLGIINVLPNLVGALIIFLVGLIFASVLSSVVKRIIDFLKIDVALSKMGVEEHVERAGLKLSLGKFLRWLTYWFVLLAFLMAAADILGLSSFSDFLKSDVLVFIPRVFVAVLIMLASVFLGNFLKNLVVASLTSGRLGAAHFLGMLAWWSVVVFGFFAALSQLKIAEPVVLSLVTGLIAMLALAGGLAFGLGGKEYAAHLLKKLQDQTER